MLGKRCVFGFITVTIAACLIGLLTFNGESVHRSTPRAEIRHAISSGTPATRSASEPETGPTYQRNGLMLTY